MSKGRRQFDKADRRARRIESMHDVARFACRIKPVTVEADDTETGATTPEGICKMAAMFFGKIEIVRRPRNIEIGVRIEPIGGDAASLPYDVDISAMILDGSNASTTVAAINVRIDYLYRASDGEHCASTELTLYGHGRHAMNSSWK